MTSFVLGELDRTVERDFEAHLTGCERCSELVLRHRRDIADIGDILKTDLLAPSGMLDRLATRLPAARTRAWWTRPIVLSLAAAVVMIAVAASAWVQLGTPKAAPVAFDNRMSADSLVLASFTPMMRGSEEALGRAVSAHVGFAMAVPKMPGGTLLGAVCPDCPGGKVPALIYGKGGQRLVLIQDAKGLVNCGCMKMVTVKGRRFCYTTRGGQSLLGWQVGGRTYLLQGKGTAADLAAEAVQLRFEV